MKDMLIWLANRHLDFCRWHYDKAIGAVARLTVTPEGQIDWTKATRRFRA